MPEPRRINARCETVHKLPLFREAIFGSRKNARVRVMGCHSRHSCQRRRCAAAIRESSPDV